MDDAVRRWLAVQRDLGGDEVYFDSPLRAADARASDAPASRPRSVGEAEAPATSPQGQELRVTRYAPGEEPA